MSVGSTAGARSQSGSSTAALRELRLQRHDPRAGDRRVAREFIQRRLGRRLSRCSGQRLAAGCVPRETHVGDVDSVPTKHGAEVADNARAVLVADQEEACR